MHGKRRLVHGAPERPGVYLFRDRFDQVLYVGKARDLRARLRSYFQTERQRASVEAALDAVERIEWRVLGSELAAALEEVQADPRAASRRRTPASHSPSATSTCGGAGRTWSSAACRRPTARCAGARTPSAPRGRSSGCSQEEFDDLLAGAPLVRLYERLADLADCLRYEDAARLRDRIASLEHVVDQLARLDRLRRVEACLLAPALEAGAIDAFFVAAGRIVARRTLSRGAGARAGIEEALAACHAGGQGRARERSGRPRRPARHRLVLETPPAGAARAAPRPRADPRGPRRTVLCRGLTRDSPFRRFLSPLASKA